MKVREVLGEWPPAGWAADDGTSAGPPGDQAELRLLWFSTPDEAGWFRLTAIDARGASWSAYCRVPSQAVWHTLERTLGACLRQPLRLIGDLEIDSAKRPILG